MPLDQLNFAPETGSKEVLIDKLGHNKVDNSIDLLRAFEPKEGYYLAFSGGKDSVVIYDLTVKSGVKFDAHYCVSPIDPPQIYKFIKEYYPDVIWDYYAKGFWKLVVKKGLPLRTSRWCCEIIKEAGGTNRVVIVGNRRAEGRIRKNQRCYEPAIKRSKYFIRPIISWTNEDVWEYIKRNQLPYCSLYDEGFKRLGCILCPFSREIERETKYFPKTIALWKRACERIVEQRLKSGKEYKYQFKTGQELFDWWVRRG